jgi:hypothetical protein
MQARGREKDSCRAARNPLPMTEHEASRTLVKSTPELWAECSDAASLARHLGAFGEIRITKLEPETAVAWEGEDVRGTVTLQPSGWGTRVILTAVPQAVDAPVDRGIADESATKLEDPVGAGTPAPGALSPEPVLPEPVVPEPVVPEPVLPKHVLPKSGLPEVSQPEKQPESPGPHRSAAAPRPGFWRRVFGGRRRATPAAVYEPAARVAVSVRPEAPDEPEESVTVAPHPQPARPEPEMPPSEPAAVALMEALDSLGRAHHRPYSRG